MERPHDNRLVRVRVRAGGKADRVEHGRNAELLVSVKARAEGNCANLSVRKLVAAHFDLPPERVRIVRGHHRPSKLLELIT